MPSAAAKKQHHARRMAEIKAHAEAWKLKVVFRDRDPQYGPLVVRVTWRETNGIRLAIDWWLTTGKARVIGQVEHQTFWLNKFEDVRRMMAHLQQVELEGQQVTADAIAEGVAGADPAKAESPYA